MTTRTYLQKNLTLTKNHPDKQQVKDLQRDLRALGYLRKGIDGAFGNGTKTAVMSLQYDLLNNSGSSTRGDGKAAISVLNYNQGRVDEISGELNQPLAACMVAMLDDQNFPKLPCSSNPVEENKKIVNQIENMQADRVPIPFLMAILKQESGLQQFQQPTTKDEDNFITVGLDTNSSRKYIITSRGYGAGQFTLFHHPARSEEVQDFMLDVSKNLERAVLELKGKFDHFVNGPDPGTQADDRITEHGNGALRVCKYPSSDTRYLRDCKACMQDAGRQNIIEDQTKLHAGTSAVYRATQYYKSANYNDVPIRKNIPCDWPYAIRRYNGAGINSYHYQVRILLFVDKQ